jgi:hypothetical protein
MPVFVDNILYIWMFRLDLRGEIAGAGFEMPMGVLGGFGKAQRLAPILSLPDE